MELTGQSPSSLKAQQAHPREDTKIIGLNSDRMRVIEHINTRIDRMFDNGFIQEVEWLLSQGYTDTLQSFQALGYQDIVAYLNNRMTYSDMVTNIKKNTQKFSKRQMTWFKRLEHVHWQEI